LCDSRFVTKNHKSSSNQTTSTVTNMNDIYLW
jgi:hypothetical protein